MNIDETIDNVGALPTGTIAGSVNFLYLNKASKNTLKLETSGKFFRDKRVPTWTCVQLSAARKASPRRLLSRPETMSVAIS